MIDMAWSDIHTGLLVRWATPNFIFYGRVVKRRGQSLVLRSIEDESLRHIPDARWYFTRGKEDVWGSEVLFVIDCLPDRPEAVDPPDPDEDFILVQEACELVLVDPKLVRRYLRRGKLLAHKDLEGRWQIHRGQFLELAVSRGWL